MADNPICAIPDCNNPHYGLGWCEGHYTRWRKFGDPIAGRGPLNPKKAAATWVQNTALTYTGDDCLLWPFTRVKTGYGRFNFKGRMATAHSAICELAHGEPPYPGLETAHSCGNAKCVNPRHLRWATHQENLDDKINHGTVPNGEKSSFAKLTTDQVISLRSIHAAGSLDREAIALKFGISPQTVTDITRRRTWRHI